MQESTGGLARPTLISKILVIVLAPFASISAFGQTFGEVTGRVSDPSGASVPNAVLTLTSVSTNAARSTESTGEGFYTFPLVPPGIYNLKAEHPGFKIAASNNIEVQVQQSLLLDFTLQVGDVGQTVEISASATLRRMRCAPVSPLQ